MEVYDVCLKSEKETLWALAYASNATEAIQKVKQLLCGSFFRLEVNIVIHRLPDIFWNSMIHHIGDSLTENQVYTTLRQTLSHANELWRRPSLTGANEIKLKIELENKSSTNNYTDTDTDTNIYGENSQNLNLACHITEMFWVVACSRKKTNDCEYGANYYLVYGKLSQKEVLGIMMDYDECFQNTNSPRSIITSPSPFSTNHSPNNQSTTNIEIKAVNFNTAHHVHLLKREFC